MLRKLPWLLLTGLALLILWQRPAAAAQALILTDIHFNPLADRSLAAQLAAAPAERWAAILDRGGERLSAYGKDTDWKLLRTALAAMKARKKPAMVLAPGDFLAHRFRAIFDASFARHDDAAYRRFVAKTMRFLARQLEAAFPHTPILPALGNNDSDCGDYGIRPGGPFLAATAPIVARLIGAGAGRDFAASWSALGNYTAVVRAVPDEIVALNDIYFSPHYRNACGDPADGNPTRATLAWLGRVLAKAARAHRQAILLYHIPPGADAFATARRDSCPLAPVPLLAQPYAAALHRLVYRYRHSIAAEIAGHLHMDAFRIRRDRNGAAFGFVMIAPALSPIFGQNPAFRRLRIAGDGGIADATIFHLANLRQAAMGAAPRWRAEASFDRRWGATRFDAASLDALYRRLAVSPKAAARWAAIYGVHGPASAALAGRNFALYRCSVGSDRLADVARCLCDRTR